MFYNFVRVHKTLRVTPAMAAAVTERLWEVSDIVALWEAVEPKTGKRGPYKKTAGIRLRARQNGSPHNALLTV